MEVLSSGFVFDIRSRQKDLRHGMIVFTEKLIVRIHQLTLTDGCRRLFCGNIGGAFAKSELADTHTDRAGRDQDQLMSRIFEVAHHTAKFFYSANVDKPRRVSQRRCSDFNDNSHSFSYPIDL